MTTSYWAPYVWLNESVSTDVRLVEQDGRWISIQAGAAAAPSDLSLPGLVLPGFANTHSHAFHRALRGRTHDGGGTFWTWRDRMYSLAKVLQPDSYYRLARAVYAEMALSGVTSVGEFHYLHHRADGTAYDDPNAFGSALIRAAAESGIRITLLDACYLTGGLGVEGYSGLDDVQVRFSDGTAARWADRVSLLQDSDSVRIGAAVHSVRAVPDDQLSTVIGWATNRSVPLHAHVSEQPAENEATLAMHGCTPTELLAGKGFLGPLSTAVHATHLTAKDIALYGSTGTHISFCPTTERDLADGIGPASALADAGARITLGSDQNAVVDLIEEVRALEMNDRLATQRRGRFRLSALVDSLTRTGHTSLGWPDAGAVAVGNRADLVAVRLDTPRTAGVLAEQAILAATAADVDTVVVDGRTVVSAGRHRSGDVGRLLAEAIAPLWRS
jgi:formiminoglutamate deiminase